MTHSHQKQPIYGPTDLEQSQSYMRSRRHITRIRQRVVHHSFRFHSNSHQYTVIDDNLNIQSSSSESSDGGIDQEVGASNPLSSSNDDDQSKYGDQLKLNQEDEETTKELALYQQPELTSPPVFIVGASAINKPPEKNRIGTG